MCSNIKTKNNLIDSFRDIWFILTSLGSISVILIEAFTSTETTDESTRKILLINESFKHDFILISISISVGFGLLALSHLLLSSFSKKNKLFIKEKWIVLITYGISQLIPLICMEYKCKHISVIYNSLYRLNTLGFLYVNMKLLESTDSKVWTKNVVTTQFMIASIGVFTPFFKYKVFMFLAITIYFIYQLYFTYKYFYETIAHENNPNKWKEVVVYGTTINIVFNTFVVIVLLIIFNGALLKDNNNFQLLMSLQILKDMRFIVLNHTFHAYENAEIILNHKKLDSLKEFIRQLSHEIRTPMGVVQMSLGNMNDIMNVKDCEPCLNQVNGCSKCSCYFKQLYEGIQDATESSDVAVGILNDCLDIDKISSGLLHCDLIPVSLGKFIKTTSKIFYGKSVTKNILFDYSVCEKQEFIDLIVKIDPPKMAQVLRNLLSNALKFTKSGGEIKINVETFYKNMNNYDKNSRVVPLDIESPQQHNFVRIEVKDNGIGISEKNVRKMFNESIQIDAYQNQKGGGSGFGLLIAKKIMEQHNGDIGVYSFGEGKGSTFWSELAICDEIIDNSCDDINENKGSGSDIISNRRMLMEATKPTIRQEQNIELRQVELSNEIIEEATVFKFPCALIVEDTEICSKLLAKSFAKCNIETVIKENGREAVNEIKAYPNKYDIIFMDNKMPIMNGLDATEEIRRLSFDNPIIGATGNILDNEIEEFKNKGANEVLGKPIKNEQIKDVLIRYGII